MLTRFLSPWLLVGLFAVAGPLHAQGPGAEPGWSPVIVATGPMRQQIQSTPIHQRPYRPLHFYGNTLRRMHYRSTPLPSVGEMVALPLRIITRP